MSVLQKATGYVLASSLMAILLGSVLAAPAFSAYASNSGPTTGFIPKNNAPHLPPNNDPQNNTNNPPQNGPSKNAPHLPGGSTLPKNPPGDYSHAKCAKNSQLCFPLASAKCKHGDTLPNGKYRHNCQTNLGFT